MNFQPYLIHRGIRKISSFLSPPLFLFLSPRPLEEAGPRPPEEAGPHNLLEKKVGFSLSLSLSLSLSIFHFVFPRFPIPILVSDCVFSISISVWYFRVFDLFSFLWFCFYDFVFMNLFLWFPFFRVSEVSDSDSVFSIRLRVFDFDFDFIFSCFRFWFEIVPVFYFDLKSVFGFRLRVFDCFRLRFLIFDLIFLCFQFVFLLMILFLWFPFFRVSEVSDSDSVFSFRFQFSVSNCVFSISISMWYFRVFDLFSLLWFCFYDFRFFVFPRFPIPIRFSVFDCVFSVFGFRFRFRFHIFIFSILILILIFKFRFLNFCI